MLTIRFDGGAIPARHALLRLLQRGGIRRGGGFNQRQRLRRNALRAQRLHPLARRRFGARDDEGGKRSRGGHGGIVRQALATR